MIVEKGAPCHNFREWSQAGGEEWSTVRRIQRRADGYSALMVFLPPQPWAHT